MCGSARLYLVSARNSGRRRNSEGRLRPTTAKNLKQMVVAERYAAFSRHVIGPRDVNENGTAMAGADRIVVKADLDDQIVDMVDTPQLFMAC